MNSVANKQVICDVLINRAKVDRDVVVLCSDSRGSSSMTPFAEQFPLQFVEIGIAEQNLVSVAAGLARCGKKAYVASPACFLTTRSMEQAKVDVAYSNMNVKLIGVSGGVSYGALGMTHHSANDIAVMASIPNMRVYLPSDRFQTKALMEKLYKDDLPAYIRVGRGAVPDVYEEGFSLEPGSAVEAVPGRDVTVIACGEMVGEAVAAARELKLQGVSCRVIDMYCVKPIDKETVLRAARETGGILTVEEHTVIGGLGAMVSQLVAANCPKRVINLGLPDEPALAGNSREVFDYYGLNAKNIFRTVLKMLEG